jgi:solute carrier family 25 S-adenosylmethionine transporter 26
MPVVDALAGALGEVAQILVLYPLDTVKIRCQCTGRTAGEVVTRLLRKGVNLQLLRKLYAGALGAAACAVVIGAVHYMSFEAGRRSILRFARGDAAATHARHTGHERRAAEGAAEASSAEAAPGAGGCAAGEPQQALGRVVATWGAAAFAAVATALVEAPVELFRCTDKASVVHCAQLPPCRRVRQLPQRLGLVSAPDSPCARRPRSAGTTRRRAWCSPTSLPRWLAR